MIVSQTENFIYITIVHNVKYLYKYQETHCKVIHNGFQVTLHLRLPT